jgi:3-dehydroquinate synthase
MKNVIGNFYPPREIYIISNFLLTLTDQEIKSGLGEIFKVSVIDGLDSFFEFSNNYDGLLMNRNLLSKYIKYALKVKKEYIEIDEYDRGVRNIFNYGHSFGHAIESASDFLIPHGIAVSIGMDIANFISLKYGFLDYDLLNKMHTPLLKNYIKYRDQMPKTSAMIKAISSDKKNTFKNFALILLGADNKLSKVEVKNDNFFADNLNLALEFIDHE